jgi:TP901 family phage tail tape measure protein
MAYTERALTILEIDGKQASDKLNELGNKLEQLTIEKKKLSKEPLTDPKLLKQVDREIAQTRKEMTHYKKEIVDVRKVMNNLSGASLKQLEAAYRRVNAERKNMSRSHKDYNALVAMEKKFKAEIDKANNSLRQRKPLLSRMAEGFDKWSGIATAALASWAGLIIGVKGAIDSFMELDEKLADVRKTTGLSADGVQNLSNELAKIDTRTSQLELLDLARVAGKLGITAQDEIIGFVNASNQVAVALSEDLGGNVEEAVNQLGKLVEIFGIKDEFGIEQALLKIGSTINSLGAAGTANEAYMIEFAKRVGGIAPMAGISIDKIMGLGATLDELGQTAEVSGTTVTNVIGTMFKDTASYAAIAGMSVEDFSKLMNTDANEAFIKVLEGAKGTSGGFQTLANNLDALGIDGSRSIGVLSVLANNIDLLRERQKYANDEFVRGGSLTDEYNVKNETATAKLEKAKKAFKALSVELGQKLQPAMTGIVSKASLLLKTISALVDFFAKYGKTIITLTGYVLVYVAASKLATYWTKLFGQQGIISSVAVKIYSTAVGLLTGKIKLATIATQLLNKASKANLWGVLAAGVIYVVSQFAKFIKETNAAAKAVSKLTAMKAELSKSIMAAKSSFETERRSINESFNALKNLNPESEKAKQIRNELNNTFGKYLPNLLTEKTSLYEIARAQKLVNDQLLYTILLNSRNEQLEQQLKPIYDAMPQSSAAFSNELVSVLNIPVGDAMQMVNQYVQYVRDNIDTLSNDATSFSYIMAGIARDMGFTFSPDMMLPATMGAGQLFSLLQQEKLISDSIIASYDAIMPNAPELFDHDNNMYSPPDPDSGSGSGSGSGSDAAEKARKDNAALLDEYNFELEQEIIATTDSLNTGLFLYEQYLDGRKASNETYWSWKTSFDDANEAAEKSRQKKWFDEYLLLQADHQHELESQLELQYAEGKITEQQYEDEKLAIKGAALISEKYLREVFAQDIADISQSIADYEVEVEALKLKRIREKREKEQAEYEARLSRYADFTVDVANQVGEATGRIFSDATKSTTQKSKEFQREILKIMLTSLKNALAIAIAETYIKEVGKGGWKGLITGTILSGVLTGVYTAAMAKIENMYDGGFSGYTGPGTKYAPGPLVQLHRGEYVIPQEGVNNPDIARIISVIEPARRNKTLRNLNFSAIPMYDGGFYSRSSAPRVSASGTDDKLSAVLLSLSDAVDHLSGKITTIEAVISFDKLSQANAKITAATRKSTLS